MCWKDQGKRSVSYDIVTTCSVNLKTLHYCLDSQIQKKMYNYDNSYNVNTIYNARHMNTMNYCILEINIGDKFQTKIHVHFEKKMLLIRLKKIFSRAAGSFPQLVLQRDEQLGELNQSHLLYGFWLLSRYQDWPMASKGQRTSGSQNHGQGQKRREMK